MTPLDEITKVAAELRDVLEDVEQLSLAIGGRPQQVDRFTGEVSERVVGSEERYKRARLEAHQTSTVKYGKKRTVDEHNTYADLEAMDAWAVWNAELAALRVAKEKAHSLRQVLSAMQTAARVESDLSR